MALKLADAVAFLRADDSQLKSDMAEAEGTMDASGGRFAGVLQGMGMAVGLGIAGIAASALTQVTAFMGDSVAAASDLGETLSKTNVLFGDSANAVVQFAEAAATNFGQSRQQALDAAATFATFGSAAGLAGDDLVGFSTGFVGLASDLASFNNTTPEQAIEAIGAALRGEAEPLRAYGVLLDDASMRQKALELGLIETTNEALTPQNKVLAAQALIYEQTGAAQGDFARTSGGLANQQRILEAQMSDLQATVGEALLPVMLTLTSSFNTLVQAVLPPLAAFIRDQVAPAFQQIADVISAVVGPAIAFIAQAFTGLGGTMQGQVNGPMAYLSGWFEQNMPRIQAIVQMVTGAMTAFWEQHGAMIQSIVQNYLSWMVAFWDTMMRTILDIVTVALQLLTGDWQGAGDTMRGIVSRWWEFFRDAFEAIRRAITSIDWGGVGRAMIDAIWQGTQNTWGNLESFMRNSMENLRRMMTNIDWGHVGRAIVDAIWQGMQNAWGGLQSWFDDRLQEMRNMLPFSEPKDPSSPLRNLGASGEAIVEQIRGGIERAGALMPPALGMQPQAVAAGVMPSRGAINITLNISGAADAGGVGIAARDGLLSALRSAGLR